MTSNQWPIVLISYLSSNVSPSLCSSPSFRVPVARYDFAYITKRLVARTTLPLASFSSQSRRSVLVQCRWPACADATQTRLEPRQVWYRSRAHPRRVCIVQCIIERLLIEPGRASISVIMCARDKRGEAISGGKVVLTWLSSGAATRSHR